MCMPLPLILFILFFLTLLLLFSYFLFEAFRAHRDLPSFPTRRSSDLRIGVSGWRYAPWRKNFFPVGLAQRRRPGRSSSAMGDRKSTRLNSSHVAISYAVFCLKKKTSIRLMRVSVNLTTSMIILIHHRE